MQMGYRKHEVMEVVLRQFVLFDPEPANDELASVLAPPSQNNATQLLACLLQQTASILLLKKIPIHLSALE